MACFTSNREDLDATVRDLRHLEFKQTADQVRVRPGKVHLNVGVLPVNANNISLDAITMLQLLAWNLFRRQQNSVLRLNFGTQLNNDNSPFIGSGIGLHHS